MNLTDMYPCCHREEGKLLLAKAHATNDQRDAQDKANGNAIPGDAQLGFDGWLRDALCALGAGLDAKDWNCVAEGAAMIQECELQIRKHFRSESDDLQPTPGNYFIPAHPSKKELETGLKKFMEEMK